MEIYGFYNGEKKSLTQLAAESGVSYDTLLARYKAGVPFGELVDIVEGRGVSEEELAGLKQELTQYVDDAVAAVPQSDEFRPNLLDNWYFGNPVNQRGKTSYTATGYTVDRWRATGKVTVAVESGRLTFSATTASAWLMQQLEFPVTGTLTLSALAKSTGVAGALSLRTNGAQTVLQQRNVPISSTYQLVTFTFKVEESDIVNELYAMFSGTAGASVDILAVKLELGDTQTLAHQDASGGWVLNEIPNYAEQLARCQRFYYRFGTRGTYALPFGYGRSSSATAAKALIPLPVAMRDIPTLTAESNIEFAIASDGMSATLSSSPTPFELNVSGLIVDIASSGMTSIRPVILTFRSKTTSGKYYIELSADL